MNYRNPVYTANGWIDCEIEHEVFGWIPFTCDPNDTGALFDTAALFAEMQPHAAPYAPPPASVPTADQIRAERDRLITASDWTQVADAPVDQAAWVVYRQALRNVPQQAGFPKAVIWPPKPE